MFKSLENKLLLTFNLACEEGDSQKIKEVLPQLDFLDRISLDQLFPLHSAVKSGSESAIEFLIKSGFAVNLQNSSGQTPLFLACFYQHMDIVELLIKYNSDVNISDNRGWTPLMLAVKNNCVKIVQLLVNKGNTNQDIKDRLGKKGIDKASALEIFDPLKRIDTEVFDMNSEPNRRSSNSKPPSAPQQCDAMDAVHILGRASLKRLLEEQFQRIREDLRCDFGSKLKDRLWEQFKKIGLITAEKNLETLVYQIEEQVKRSGELLVSETNRNLESKHEKFLRGIEKFATLKLKLLISQISIDNREEGLVNTQNDQNIALIESHGHIAINQQSLKKSKSTNTQSSLKQRRNSLPSNRSFTSLSNSESPLYNCESHLTHSESQVIGEIYPFPDLNTKKLCIDFSCKKESKFGLMIEGTKPYITDQTGKMSDEDIIKLLVKQNGKVTDVIKDSTAKVTENIIEKKFQALQKSIVAELNRLLAKSVQDVKNYVDFKYKECLELSLQHQQLLSELDKKRTKKDTQIQTYIRRQKSPEKISTFSQDVGQNTKRSVKSEIQKQRTRVREEEYCYEISSNKDSCRALSKNMEKESLLSGKRRGVIREMIDKRPPRLGSCDSRESNNQHSQSSFTFRKEVESKIKDECFSSNEFEDFYNKEQIASKLACEQTRNQIISTMPSEWSTQNYINKGKPSPSSNSLLEILSPPHEVREISFIERKTVQGISFFIPTCSAPLHKNLHTKDSERNILSDLPVEQGAIKNENNLGSYLNDQIQPQPDKSSLRKIYNNQKENVYYSELDEYEGLNQQKPLASTRNQVLGVLSFRDQSEGFNILNEESILEESFIWEFKP